jgi:hypothetical protein
VTYPLWRNWLRARSLAARARFLTWKLARPTDAARARRLYRRALLLLGADATDDAQLATACARQIRWLTAPPLRAVWAWANAHRRPASALITALALGAIASGLWSYRVELHWVRNLAKGRAWSTDSSYQGNPRQGVLARPSQQIFFHTDLEPSPAIHVDLERPRTFSRIRVVNRQDCCSSRAIPLVVEVSNDRVDWRPVLERQLPFSELSAKIPATSARFVRIRVKRLSYLHLTEIGLYRW